MPSVTLQDRFVSSVRVRIRTNYFDTKIKGLVLRVSPKGSKAWLFVFRVGGKSPQWLAVGSYPALALVDARKQALEHRKTVDVDGIDPVAVKRAEEAAKAAPPPPQPKVFTFRDLVELYIVFAKARKKTWNDDVQKINRYLLPVWGSMPVRAITRAHVHELLDTLVAQGMTVGVNRVQAVISRLFTVALDRGHVDAHPAARMLKRAAERPGDRVLSDDELRDLWAGLDAHPGEAADVVRLRALLGQRGGEVLGMTWAEIDATSGMWEIPGSRTKNGKAHSVPLAKQAQAVLELRRASVPDDEPRVFPGVSRWSDDYRTLAAIHGGRYEWKDLRRTVATRLAGLGFSETTIGRVLNHARHTVTSKHYNQHEYLTERRAALDAWDREMQRIIEGKGKTKTSGVLRFAKG